MAITKYLPSKPFSSGTEYEVFKYNYCNRCKKHKERENGFPAFPEDGGCPIEDAMEFARFDRERFPGDKIRKLIDSDGDVAKWHHCMEFETWQVNKMSELKRCPFCGGSLKKIGSKRRGNQFYVHDLNGPDCILKEFAFKADDEEKIKRWNTRKPMENIVERLEEQAEECRKYWQEFDDEDSFGGMNAYCDAVKIVKEEGGMK